MALVYGLVMAIFTLLFAGDVMLNGVRPSERVFSGIHPAVQVADLALANLEIPWTTSQKATVRKTPAELKARDQFILKADPGHARHFGAAGFDLVSLANNHAMDYGWGGLKQTIWLLDREKISYAGAGADEPRARAVQVEVLPDGTRVGLMSAMAFMSAGALYKTTPATNTRPGVYSYAFGGTVGAAAKARLAIDVREARRKCDLLIVALHWGTERKTLPNPYQVDLGRALIDAGADVVWGHHPHVLQGAELYRGKPIFYSMGNLVSPLPGTTGLIRMHIGSKRVRYEFLPARISGGRVALTEAKLVAADRRRFRELCSSLVRRFAHPQSKALPL